MIRTDSKKLWKVILITGLIAALAVLPGCSDDDPDAVTYPVDPAGIDVSESDHCDILQPTKCLYPFPNDYYTVPDPGTDTGLMINLSPLGMPVNVSGKAIDPEEWNRNDGFSPGAMILTHVPGIDMDETGAVPLTDIERSLDDDAPILVIDAETGSRHLIWSELDSNATEEEGRALVIRPAKNFQDGKRYIVALRNLRDGEGELIPPSDAFLVFREKVPSTIAAFESRRSHMEDVFSRLADAGVERNDLFLAWDFTVASTRNIAERMLHIRDDAFGSLGSDAPLFEIENEDVVEYTKEQDERIGRSIHGRIRVPNYMDTDSGEPGSAFYYDPADGDDLPDRLSGNNFLWQEFTCNIPHLSLDAFESGPGEGATRPSLYGHGLLGSQGEVNSSHVDNFANTHNLMFCAVDWLGMSNSDIGVVAGILSDLSNFKALADRCQQGMLGFLFLARLLKHDQGFAAHTAFQVDETSVFDNSDVFYDGNSQGGIMGGALMAVSQDITRGVLGVPGMNYSLLLRRSVDFDSYGNAVLYPSYPDTLDRSLLLSLLQMLWDRAEANGYANHMTDDPLSDTPPHKILLQVAFGDHQVTHTSAEIEARTIGAHIHMPAAAEGRHHDLDPYYGISSIDEYPFDGSAITIWDGGPVPNDHDEGTPTPPVANLPPREGKDPHERPRRQPDAMRQKSEFLKSDGMVVDVCGDDPCFSDGYTGEPVQ